jgi:hypothetical protein
VLFLQSIKHTVTIMRPYIKNVSRPLTSVSRPAPLSPESVVGVRSFSLKRGISVSFQAITYLKSGPKQLGSLIILAQNISNFGNGMHGMALLSLRLHCSNNLPPRRRVKPPISCLSLPMTSELYLTHRSLIIQGLQAFIIPASSPQLTSTSTQLI